MVPPSSLVIFQGWGLIDLPLRASNEGLLRPRVARAQKIIRLHPFPCSGSTGLTWVPFQSFSSFIFYFLPPPRAEGIPQKGDQVAPPLRVSNEHCFIVRVPRAWIS